MKTDVLVDIPTKWVMLPDTELGAKHKIGQIIEAFRSNIRVSFYCKDGKQRIGIYHIWYHPIRTPHLEDWLEYAEGIENGS